MQRTLIAFDIDGTLRCNCTATCHEVNEGALELARLFRDMKNTKLIAWSGGGAQYALSFVASDDRLVSIFGISCYSKLDATVKPDIAVDDQHDFGLGKINLIGRYK